MESGVRPPLKWALAANLQLSARCMASRYIWRTSPRAGENCLRMKIVAISDVHGHFDIDMPTGDVLIVAGDVCDNSSEQFAAANAWLSMLPHRHKLYVAGNHDTHTLRRPDLLPSVTRLIDETVGIGGLRFYGLPWQFGDRVVADLQIPERIDVLISHEPPYGIGDWSPRLQTHIGNRALRVRVQEVKPKLHVFGHAHFGYGSVRLGETLYVNAAICGDPARGYYAAAHAATVIKIEGNGGVTAS
jgi:Icc-related predicted phosphoesterase